MLKQGKKTVSITPRLLDISVLMGGPSTEREVSLVSGAAVADALARLGHRVTRSDISPADISALSRSGIDLVFIALHGDFGESGDVQDLCEKAGLRYTGCGPAASRLAMNKHAAKQVFAAAGLRTPRWQFVQAAADIPAARQLPLPVVVKPVDGGSSVDCFICRDAAARDKAIDTLLAKYKAAVVEQFIHGKELTVGILGDSALPLIEIVPTAKFYDYQAKYADGAGTRYLFDSLPADQELAIQAAALKAHQSLGCRDMSRIDFILDDAGQAWLLEANTIPGFTGHSLLPMAARKAGLEFDQLVQRLVEMAMARPKRGE